MKSTRVERSGIRDRERERDAFTAIFPLKVPYGGSIRAVDVSERIGRISLLSHVRPCGITTAIFRDGFTAYVNTAARTVHFGAQSVRVRSGMVVNERLTMYIGDTPRAPLRSAAMTHFSDAPTRPRIPFGIHPRRADPVVLRPLRELRERTRSLYPMKYTERLTVRPRRWRPRRERWIEKEHLRLARNVFPLNVAFSEPVMTSCQEMNL